MKVNQEFWTLSNDNIYVDAHRGFSVKYPENTLPSFEAACKLGVDMVETDIRITKDGELVTIHDATVDRTTNAVGTVRSFTLSELKKLDAHYNKVGFDGVQIPKFTEFMDLMKQYNMKTLCIELKEYPENYGNEAYEICDRILQIIEDYGYSERFVVNTFSPRLQEYVYTQYKGKYLQHVYWPMDRLISKPKIDQYEYAYCCCMFGRDRGMIAEKKEFDAMKARGVSPWAGAGVKTFEDVKLAAERGSELITCNNPDEILAYLRRLGKHQ